MFDERSAGGGEAMSGTPGATVAGLALVTKNTSPQETNRPRQQAVFTEKLWDVECEKPDSAEPWFSR